MAFRFGVAGAGVRRRPRTVLRPRLAAGAAQPVHGGVRDVGREPERLVEPRDELVGDGQRGLADPAAAPADDVQVGRVLGEVVARRPVVDVGVPDQAELLQRLERAVDGGGADTASAPSAATASTISSGVAWPSRPTAASTRSRCDVRRLPRARSRSPRSLTPPM